MTLHVQHHVKPDGRDLWLYAPTPFAAPSPDLVAACPQRGESGGNHLRWHPLRGEWIIYAGARQGRTFLPPPDWNPLAPTSDPAHPSELPAGDWQVAVFENLFPALHGTALAPLPPLPQDVITAPSGGRCEVVVYTQDPTTSLAALPVAQVELVLAVWAERTAALGRRADVAYVFPFENRGVEVGVTLQHPHGQIYAYPFVPPAIERELTVQRSYHAHHGRGPLTQLIEDEVTASVRMLHTGEHAVAFVPACARWAYEIWIAPRRAVATLAELTELERHSLAVALSVALRKLDGLWQRPMPYVLTVHQAPSRGEHPGAHAHIEIYPWLRMKDRLKYLAGSEVGAGAFTADTLPEAKAAELRAVEIASEPAPPPSATTPGEGLR